MCGTARFQGTLQLGRICPSLLSQGRGVGRSRRASREGGQHRESFRAVLVSLLSVLELKLRPNPIRRASAVYRISRFPLPRSEKQRYAWEEGKKAATRGLELRQRPTKEVVIPHKHGLEHEGKEIPFYYHLPPGISKDKPVPLVVILTGLDGYRTELAVWIEGWSQKNVATVVLEIPGTGDSPAAPNDPTSPDREWSSLFDWIDKQPEIDHSKVAMWAYSTGGYYAIRLAHTHHDRLAGVVALGGGCHHMFSPEWLSQVNHLEYPFDLATTLAYKFGYGDDLEMFKKEAMKFSLVEDGTLDRPICANLLLVNGVNDE